LRKNAFIKLVQAESKTSLYLNDHLYMNPENSKLMLYQPLETPVEPPKTPFGH